MRIGEDPFSEDVSTKLVKTSKQGGDYHVHTRESSTKEFKESFTWGSIGLYARTMAAFANARGGYIIFGITDNPRVLIGLEGKSLKAFEDLDQAKLTQELNEIFSPEMHWVADSVQIDSRRTVGVIYTFESDEKPVIARKPYQQQNAKILEGDILYRYNSRTQRIRFPELRRVLDEARTREQSAMMTHIDALVRAGASNAAVLDFSQNVLQGPSGQKVLMDEKLLAEVSFIREGEFDEVVGAPTLKIVGEVQPVTTIAIGEQRIVRSALSSDDVLHDFIHRHKVGNAEQYVRQAATGTTGFLPVQYYRVLANMSHEDLLSYVDAVTTRAPAKRKLQSRLETGDDMRMPLPASSSSHPSTIERRASYDALTSPGFMGSRLTSAREALRTLEAIKWLDDDQIREVSEESFPLMAQAFEDFYSSDAKVADALRRAACRVDSSLYGSA